MPTLVLWYGVVLGLLFLGGPQGETQSERYPVAWNIRVRQGTRLDSLKRALDRRVSTLPPKDAEDRQPLPPWFRVYLRSLDPSLPDSGPVQYPKGAVNLLRWLGKNQNYSPPLLNAKVEQIDAAISSVLKLEEKKRGYPKRWEVTIPPGTRLDSLRRTLDGEITILPEKDLEDTSPLPAWFRVYLRKKFPNLATTGPYQYPRTANRILQRMIAHPDSVESLR